MPGKRDVRVARAQFLGLDLQSSGHNPECTTTPRGSRLPAANMTKRVNEALKPTTRDDKNARATFLAHSFFARSGAYVRVASEQLSLEFGGMFDPSMTLDPLVFEQAAKKLAVMSVHLAGLECGGTDNSEWFMDFLFAAHLELDRMTAQPSARALIEMHGQWIVSEIISGVSQNAASSVEPAMLRESVVRQLIDLLSEDVGYRADVVVFALSESWAVLQEHQILFDSSS